VALASVASWLLVPVTHADSPAATHVVQPGETLSDIATGVGVDSATLAALNAIDDVNMVVVGQTIKLPSNSAAVPPSSARSYTVAAGDTLWSVAQQLGTSTAALIAANHLDDPDHLVAGAQLTLPTAVTAGSGTSPAPAPDARPAAATTNAVPKRTLLVSYTVQAGETLSQIALQFDATTDAIAQASGLDDANRLSIGTVLKVPVPGREHVVQAGETLRDIAAQEKVDLGSLIDFNALDDPELIRVGQVVLVPVAPNGLTVASSNLPVVKPAAAAPAPAASNGSAPGAAASTAATKLASPAPAQPAAAAKPAAAPAAAKPAAAVAASAPPPGSPAAGLAGAGLKFLGAPYVWGGSSPAGFDCSGFVWYVARQAGKQLSRGMLGEYNGGPHPARDELKPGDLVFFQNTYSAGLSHNGIYIGNGQFVHAADEAAGVTVSSLGTAYWSSHWFGATRLP